MKVIIGLSVLLLGLSTKANATEISIIRCGIQGPIIVRLTDGSIIEYKKNKSSVRFPDWYTRVTFQVTDFNKGSTRINFFTDDAQMGHNYKIATFITTGERTGNLAWERRDPWGGRKTKNYRCIF